MCNLIYEPAETYNIYRKGWTAAQKFHNSELIGGYGSYVEELIRIDSSQRSLQKPPLTDVGEIDYRNYHFTDEALKFNRDEIHER